MTRAADILTGARHAATVQPAPAATGTAWPATDPVREAFWSGVLCAVALFGAAFCVAVSFGVFEGIAS